MNHKRLALGLLFCMLLVVSGCAGSTRGAVQGKVTWDGDPLEEGEISFIPLDPKLGPTAGAPIRRGEYAIDAARGPVAGKYRVQINAFRKTGRKVWDGMGDEKAPAAQKNFVEEIEAFIPPRYNERSDLRATVEAGKVNHFDWPLKSDPRK